MRKISLLLLFITMMLVSFTAGVRYERGDVNQDGKVSISDVTALIDYLLSGAWPDEPVIPEDPVDEVFTVNGVTFKMIGVKCGTFMMGASEEQGSDATSSELPVHQVTLTKNFNIGETEVTQALWVAVMGENPSYYGPTSGYGVNYQRPVESVSWIDCQEFIRRLTELTGKSFRLPTEAEWEYAARGGEFSHSYKYAGSNNIDDVAWHNGNSNSVPQSVATKAPNELGLYDMSGNVYEWVEDWYAAYPAEAQTDPVCTESSIAYRVLRGGSVGGTPKYSRVSYRGISQPDAGNLILGLRLAY
jgi:formylglycine-generating enzyme required for sulfatase activity